MIRAHRADSGNIVLISDDGVVVPLTANEAHAVYLLVAEDLDRARRALEEPEAPDA